MRRRLLARSSISPRSPLPLLVGALAVAALLIVVARLPREAGPDPTRQPTLSEREALSVVAEQMRSAQAALRVSSEGTARFEDKTWYVAVGDAQFHFRQRTRIVVPDNQAARLMQFGGPAAKRP